MIGSNVNIKIYYISGDYIELNEINTNKNIIELFQKIGKKLRDEPFQLLSFF